MSLNDPQGKCNEAKVESKYLNKSQKTTKRENRIHLDLEVGGPAQPKRDAALRNMRLKKKMVRIPGKKERRNGDGAMWLKSSSKEDVRCQTELQYHNRLCTVP